MIHENLAIPTQQGWQQVLSNAVSDAHELLVKLGLSSELTPLNKEKIANFPVRVPQSYINKMRYGDKNDPLLRQVFPYIDEAIPVNGFVSDPVGDLLSLTSNGVLQKYQGRALLVTTGACAIHCRYCFRRHFPYSDSNPLAGQWQQTLEQIKSDKTIHEVILSGGDPLSLSDKKLCSMVADIQAIPHIKRLRIHTRLPLVVPQRITAELLEWINACKLKVVMVIHANHANEIDAETALALAKLHQAGCQLLNQSVLLKGVNDSANALIDLSDRLHEVDVLPYYLHLLDKVAGAGHFDVSDETGIALIKTMRSRLPGYLVPRLVREQQGEPSKTLIL